jgi:hypothetical protein
VSGPVFISCAPGLVFGGTEGVESHFNILRSRTSFQRYLRRRVPLSCFALQYTFSAVRRASGPVVMFCVFALIFGCTKVVGSRFHILLSQTRFRRYRVRRVPFSSFAPPNSFSAVLSASGPVFIFCAPGLIFGGTEGVGSLFNVLRARTSFRRYRQFGVPFSCFRSRSHFRRY